ncbi:ParA family protein [Robbsia sp. KACC 23696]|uniref:ParA family protein n=1 Tax=Robbsia sp. KACC 23696 TaxID=3149231 RepID=UPI00325B97BC
MSVIAVVNPKGGVGKSTLATNLAGHFAANGEWTALGDIDPQRSSHGWLDIRSAMLPAIERWELDPAVPARPPKGIEFAVLDTPAGLSGATLQQVAAIADKLIVPLQASIFDIFATQAFLRALAEDKALKRRHTQIGIVGMRVDQRTKAADELHRFVEGLGITVLGDLRDTQNYVQLAAHGRSIWDVGQSRVEKDLPQWTPIIDWVRAKGA